MKPLSCVLPCYDPCLDYVITHDLHCRKTSSLAVVLFFVIKQWFNNSVIFTTFTEPIQ